MLYDLGGSRSQIFFVHNPILVYDEGHHPRRSIFRRISDERKTACHLSIDHIAVASPFAFQNFKIVSIEWLMLLTAAVVAGSRSNQGANRAGRLALRGLPVESIVFSR